MSSAAPLTTVANPRVFMDIQIGNERVGRMTFELFADTTPKTAENFRALCTGERGIGRLTHKPLSFKNTIFHRVIQGFMAQGGDFSRFDGTGGESIYGGSFKDENFVRKHTARGLLSMANAGRNTNGSQFFICFRATSHLDNKHVVFGKLMEGMEILDRIEGTPTNKADKPLQEIRIVDCGELAAVKKSSDEVEEPLNVLEEFLKAQKTQIVLKESASRLAPKPKAKGLHGEGEIDIGDEDEEEAGEGEQEQQQAGAVAKKEEGKAKASRDAGEIELDDEEEEEAEAEEEAEEEGGAEGKKAEAPAVVQVVGAPDFSKMTPQQKKLWELKQKIRDSKAANKKEVTEEKKRFTATGKSASQTKREEYDRAEEERKKTISPEEEEEARLLSETADKNQQRAHKASKKQGAGTFGWDVFNQDAQYNAYKKRLNHVKPNADSAKIVKDHEDIDYGRDSKVSEAAIDHMVAELEATHERRSKFSRRRPVYADQDIDFISERNRVFNKKVRRAYDVYTQEIKSNLERGTAL